MSKVRASALSNGNNVGNAVIIVICVISVISVISVIPFRLEPALTFGISGARLFLPRLLHARDNAGDLLRREPFVGHCLDKRGEVHPCPPCGNVASDGFVAPLTREMVVPAMRASCWRMPHSTDVWSRLNNLPSGMSVMRVLR